MTTFIKHGGCSKEKGIIPNKQMKKLLYLTIFLLSLSSVLAVTLDITYNNEDYAKFKIEGCSGTS